MGKSVSRATLSGPLPSPARQAVPAPPGQALRGLLACAGAAALWAIAATVASDLFDSGVPPLHLTAARSVVAAAGLALIPRIAPRGRMPVPALVAFGLSIALVNGTYYIAIDRLAVAVAVVIQYAGPIFVVAWAALIARRPPSRTVLLACGVSVLGVALVSEVAGATGPVDAVGLVAAAASALLFASYTVLSERAADAYGTVGGVLRAFVMGSGFWTVVLIFLGDAPRELVDPSNLPRVLFVGVFGTLVPFLLYIWGIQRVRAERAVITATLEPVLAALFAWIFLAQSLTAMQLLGGIVVVVAVSSLQLEQTRRKT
ncbi:MAG TPA: EamA family transporter [Actinomycetota bacterium]|nr:EamA family transporter [Actinomycetota bacterium]